MRSDYIKKTTIFLAVLAVGWVMALAQPAVAADANAPVCQGKGMHAHRHGHWLMREMSEKLNLTDAQKAAIKPIFAADANAIKAVRQDSSLSKEQKMAKIREIRQSGVEKINVVLTPDQQKEFVTLREQMRHKMLEHRFEMLSEKFNLTDVQKAAIKPIFAADANAVKAVWQDNSLSKEQKIAKTKEIRQSGKEQINKILTPEQQAKWAELKKQMHHRGMKSGNKQCQPAQKQVQKPADSNA